jgi:hypothetical protein
MKRTIRTIFLLCATAFLLQAQPVDPAPKLTAKIGAFSLIDPVLPSLNIMGEFQIKGRWYGQLEAGVILDFEDRLEGLSTENRSGLRLRPAIRYYYQEQRNRYFMELLLVYRQVSMDIDGQFFIIPETGPTYNQLITYGVDSRKFSAFFNLGLFDYALNDRLVLEMGMGLGATVQENDFSDIPDNASIISTSIISAYEPDFATTVADIRATAMLYFNIGYVLF